MNTDIEKLEILAFCLFSRCTPLNREELMSEWRSSEETRSKYRVEADDMLTNLESCGIKLQGSQTAIKAFLNTLVTRPATVMYTLENELPNGT